MPKSTLFFYKQPVKSAKRILFLFKNAQCIGMPCWSPGVRWVDDDWKKRRRVTSPRAINRMKRMNVCETMFDNDFECPIYAFNDRLMRTRLKEGWQSSII